MEIFVVLAGRLFHVFVIFAAGMQEHSLEKAKKKMLHDWESVNFTMTQYRDTGVPILACRYWRRSTTS